MASQILSRPVFKVRRHGPSLVVPAKSTPRELKLLSDIDDQEGLRFLFPVMVFYKRNPSMEGKDPAKVIKAALAKALVFYYPFAGRIFEGSNRKLIVDCTGEGVLFVEADVEVKMEELGDEAIRPVSPYSEELLPDIPGSGGIVGCPLLLIQVTRFSCGGFTFALRLNHTMSDGVGLLQFLNAIAEFAKGIPETAPSVPPLWQRELLSARQPPRITRFHHEYEPTQPVAAAPSDDDLIQRSFYFGPKELRALRNHLPPHLRARSSTFDVLTACLWKCRTEALAPEPHEIVRISCVVNGRFARGGPNVPPGYYGNVFAFPAAVSEARSLCNNPLGYAVELVSAAKAEMSGEYMRSVADLMVIRRRPLYVTAWNFVVSDTTQIEFDSVDFGWGKPVYGSVAGAMFFVLSVYSRFKDGIMVPISLPPPAMERFERELKKMITEDTLIVSKL